jgi:hypothetical protein
MLKIRVRNRVWVDIVVLRWNIMAWVISRHGYNRIAE